ncbi:MAG TPA: DEAD/DEAH box helicase [Allosphingosinicella sp.]|jgi:transcription-repair coupling factor (superfamily II helicase)
MLQHSSGVASTADAVEADASPDALPAALGPTVARLCEALEKGDAIAVASSEQRGEAIARGVAALSPATVLWFPPSDALPGETAPPSPAVSGRRFGALAALQRRKDGPVLLVTEAGAAAQMVPAPPVYAADPLRIAVGDPVREDLAEVLETLGYFTDDRIDEAGEFSIRGAAVDVFPAGDERPVRIHYEDVKVAEIGTYDPVTQMMDEEELPFIELRPALEPAPGEDAVTVFDHLPGAAVALDPEAEERRDGFVALARESGAKTGLAGAGAWRSALAGRARISLAEGGETSGVRFVEARRPERAFLKALEEARARGDRMLLLGSPRDIRFVSRRLERAGETLTQVSSWMEARLAQAGALLSANAEIDRGWREDGILVVAAADLLGSRSRGAETGAVAVPSLTQDMAEFHSGDAIIHEDHGLAILGGIERLSVGDEEGDALRLVYSGDKHRLVPIEEAARIWRYGGEAEALTLDKLDGSSWEKRRKDIDKTIAQTARQLIALAEERAQQTAPVLEPSVADYERFSAGFPFSETPDQSRAIAAVRDDLASGKPMDRLVVGDVGYGKTEVALRAAALAALAGKQVALVAPTTVLVRQHLETFTKRFSRLGIEVAALSRLSSTAEAKAVKAGLADGSVRIVVGTQMIAGKNVQFQELGLVIIDEEQRFGAADKAKLRGLAGDGGGHVLTLTATPIPRTLQSALVGLQDLSVIATPPARRLPTRTQVAGFEPDLVKAALLRERKRGGQSFVVVPQIEDMEPMAERLAKLVPSLTIRRAHGKMPAAEVDGEMVGFANGEGDILLATNIIEAGLDIPRANTMLVWRADRFGLAQLHQLRGRVGRGRVRGNFLLLTEADSEIAPATLKRLRTMEALDQLGAGFAISARDLDMRGAGELLGEEQAGHMKLIGIGLYQHLLERAIRAARGEDTADWIPKLHLGLSGRLSEDWIPEEDLRINLYVRIARLSSAAELEGLAEEMEDRFGTLPPDAAMLLETAKIRRLAREAGVERVDAGPAAIALTPRGRGLAAGAQAARKGGLEKKEGRYLLRQGTDPGERRLEAVRSLLESLIPE